MSGTLNTFDGSNPTAEAIRLSVIEFFNARTAPPGDPLTYTPYFWTSDTYPTPPGGIPYPEVVFTSGAVSAVPANYPVVYSATARQVEAYHAPTSGQAVTGQAGGLIYNIGGGDGALITGDKYVSGQSTTLAVAGDVIFVNGVNPTEVAAGEGHDTVVVRNGNDAIATGAGNNLVWLFGGNSNVASEGADTIVASAGTDTVSVTKNSTVFGGSGTLTFINGPGVGLVGGGTGNLDLRGGAGGGGVFFGGAAGNNTMVAGLGDTTLTGGGNGDTLYAIGSAHDVLASASSGNATLTAHNPAGAIASGNNAYLAYGTGNVAIVTGAGHDTVGFGHGNDTAVAGTGPDIFVLSNGLVGGADLIGGFKAGVDHVALFGYGSQVAAGANAQLAENFAGAASHVTLTDGTTITFNNIAGTNLAGSFLG